MNKALLILVFLFIEATHAQTTCHDVDLRNSNLGEIRNQGDVSWCYAFSSADLLNYYFPREKISAADIAVGFNQKRLPKFMRFFSKWWNRFFNERRYQMQHQTGFSQMALSLALQKGSCREEDFPSEIWTKVDRSTGQASFITLDQAMVDIFNLRQQVRKGLTFEEMPFYYQLKNVDAAVFYETVKYYAIDNIFAVLRRHACDPERQSYAEGWIADFRLKSKGTFTEIDNLLSSGDPLLLDYDLRILHDRNASGLKLGKLHTSVMVGRRFNVEKDRCEYLIKDSFGKDCGQYDSDYACEQGGFVWLPQELIYKKMTSFVYLKRPR